MNNQERDIQPKGASKTPKLASRQVKSKRKTRQNHTAKAV